MTRHLSRWHYIKTCICVTVHSADIIARVAKTYHISSVICCSVSRGQSATDVQHHFPYFIELIILYIFLQINAQTA